MAAKPLLGQVEDFEALMKRVVKIESQLPDDSERAEEFFFVKLKQAGKLQTLRASGFILNQKRSTS